MTILTPMAVVTVTEQEISSQPDTWSQALGLAARTHDLLLAPGERVLAVGCGTSAFMAQSYAVLRERAGLGETDWAYGSEPLVNRGYDRVVAITRSGTTTEVLDSLARVLPGTRRVGVTAVTGEPVDALTDEQLLLDFADERSVVQTRFPTTLLAAVRAALGTDLTGAIESLREVVDAPLPVDVSDFDHFVFLGTGWTIGLAHEAALKIREAAQAWSESYPGMDYRHGPIAVAGRRSLVTMIGEPPAGLVDSVRATGATVLTDDLDPLVQLVRAQRLAIALAASRGLDPDNPRALTRSVILSSAQNGDLS